MDETDRLLFPLLRAGWARRGEPLRVMLSGSNARRVIFGALNLRTGKCLFLSRRSQKGEDFRLFLQEIRRHYRGWRVALLLDEDPSHTAQESRHRAQELGIELIWLPKRAPELNPMERLWGQAKDFISANQQYVGIDEQVERFLHYLESLSNQQRLQTGGVLSKKFWLKGNL